MKILAIDTSAKVASCALIDSETRKVICSGLIDAGITHSGTLMPLLENVVRSCNMRIMNVDAFAAAVGPGSFTGIRIAVSAVKGLAYALGKPVYPVSSLLGLCWNLPPVMPDSTAILCPVMDARRGEFYTAFFRLENGIITRITPDCAAEFGFISEEIGSDYHGKRVFILGGGAEIFAKLYSAAGSNYENVTILPGVTENAVGVGFAACGGIPAVSAKALMPTYVRLSGAERQSKSYSQKGESV
ncbi:tRNA (adenosine(37)-N6)-threonylcarbamoyltransferase complex dimerization subunit type 1 TsaB [Clostridia bacterium]|nr:tRNA (adenosine(37)-N6)-threonylcarbamoyltransferase complex dimerization subunit type 1 TsaB [Clostridia bacterium]